MSDEHHRTTSHDGTSISWTRSGEGKSVFLVHGITEDSASWEPIADRLRGRVDLTMIDLRGHGASGRAVEYGLEAMAGDIAAVAADAGVASPHLVGHSLGGVVVSVMGAALGAASVVNVDQSLRLGGFKEMLVAVEPMLRDAGAFPSVVASLFDELMGSRLSDSERARLTELRHPDQEVVLGVWADLFSSSVEEIDTIVDNALAGYHDVPVPYLSIFGVDPGADYLDWISARIPGATCEVWAEHGHYPHLVEPDRFVARVEEFWAGL